MFICLEENQKLQSKTQTSAWDYVPQRTCDKVSLVCSDSGEAELLVYLKALLLFLTSVVYSSLTSSHYNFKV